MIARIIARNTFREATRDRVLIGLIGAGLVIILATLVLSPLALGEEMRLTIDLGLSAISLLGLLTILMVGTNLVSKEIERRTIYNLLSKPLARPVYLIGKWAGLTAALWSVAVTLGAALWILLLVRGHVGHTWSLLQAIYMAALELSVVTAIAVLFSALSTPVLSALYTLGLFCVGQWTDDLRVFASKFPPGVATMLEVAANLAPNLSTFNMRSLAASGTPASPEQLGIATAYALLYCGCVLALASAAFESRDFR